MYRDLASVLADDEEQAEAGDAAVDEKLLDQELINDIGQSRFEKLRFD